MDDSTTRQRIKRILRYREGVSPTSVANSLEEDLSAPEVIDHIGHISKSLEQEDESVLVAPPECKECGFDGFDKLLNIPSKCPECRSTWIEEPRVLIK